MDDLKVLIREIQDYPKPGILFYDLTTLLKDAKGFHSLVDRLCEQYNGTKVDLVVGIEARGFILGGALAHQVSAGFVPIRKRGKLPHTTVRIAYSLEYGVDEMEMHVDAIHPGERVILIDDLISKVTNEPYRMFTSRAEFRLHLRIDNADRRLTPHGRRVGLISDEAWEDFQTKQQRLEGLKLLLEKTKLTTAMLNEPLKGNDWSSAVGQSCAQLLKRPEVTIEHLVPLLRETTPEFFARNGFAPSTATISSEVRNELKSVETGVKYEGYLLQQQRAMERMKKSEQRSIPGWFDYHSVSGLSHEMQEKLSHVQPRTLAQASRIPGVTPAAVSLVSVYIEIQSRRREHAAAI